MGLIKEPLDVDFYVEPKTLTDKERQLISQHIKEYKAKMAKRKNRKSTVQSKAVGMREEAQTANKSIPIVGMDVGAIAFFGASEHILIFE